MFRNGRPRWQAGVHVGRMYGSRGGTGQLLGRKTFEPKLFYQFSLEKRGPEDPLRQRVAAVIDCFVVRRLTAR